MGLIAKAIEFGERAPLPDVVTRAGIEFLVSRSRTKLSRASADEERAFLEDMANHPIAIHTDAANSQHYEVPTEFFQRILGPRLKYSCCLYPKPQTTLAQAEVFALEETVAHADLQDGQAILEWGCGWGSLTLFMAERFPRSKILSVSNSATQTNFIRAEAKARGLGNVTAMRCDMNAFRTERRFDRIVSVEMFEHMSNWRALLQRAADSLLPGGRVFLHVFTHGARSYRFDPNDPTDWIARHFFTGGIMPAHNLPHQFPDLFAVEQEWRWSGTHYERTALDWLANFDASAEALTPVLRSTYGDAANLWRRRWRLFFLATAGLFGHAGGREWGVGHFRLVPQRPRAS